MNKQQKNTQKEILRQSIKEAWKNKPLKEISSKVCSYIEIREVIAKSKEILFFWPFKSEIDLRSLLEESLSLGKKCYLPKAFTENNELVCAYSKIESVEQDLYRGEFGNLECIDYVAKNDLASIDLVFVPALILDRKGNRLGKGLGFYDRLLGQLPDRAITLAVVPHEFLVDNLDFVDEWDKPVSFIATEQEFYKTN